MNNDVELYIRQNTTWLKLPSNVKQSLGNSQKEYEKHIVNFSVKNQLRYKGNLVRQVRKDERRYYEEMLHYSRSGLLLYPYHLSDIMVEGLRVTPFQYYTSVLEAIMDQERSYDSLPNFTAADCLRLLGIGRNEYIDLMNQCRSGRKLFRRKNVKDLLPSKPKDINVEPWWLVAAGCIVEEDMKLVSEAEKELIDRIIDHGKQRAGDLNMKLVHLLYKKGLIYLEVPIDECDYIVVPPLEGFVMNRVLGDYFETLLYKIFVSIDEHTSVGELASVLQIEPQSVKNAVSLYCRLGFARKKCADTDDWHPSWKPSRTVLKSSSVEVEDPCMMDLGDAIGDVSLAEEVKPSPVSDLEDSDPVTTPRAKRICFLFDSTLTAFLMMGNLSPGLKSHAVTMFEVGKLLDESLDGFLNELEKVSTARDDSEGEARRYFEHALILRSTILALRHGTSLHDGLDLVRCESLYPLEPDTLTRLLAKNYSLLVSMAPLSKEVRPITSHLPPHLGPASADVNTVWFKMFLYHITKDGPPSLLFTRGTRVRKLPQILRKYDKVMVTSWGHDPTVIPLASFLFAVNDALTYAPVLAQGYGYGKGAETRLVPFPLNSKDKTSITTKDDVDWREHQAVLRLSDEIDLVHTCGYVTMVRLAKQDPPPAAPSKQPAAESQPSYSPERPKNGFHSKECADILTQELDDLYDSRAMAGPSHRKEDNLPIQKDITNKQEVTASREEESTKSPEIEKETPGFDFNSWMILDCCFGVPLFEDEVNRSLCATIVNTLAVKESLEKLVESNELLRTRLQEFISTYYSINKIPSVPEIRNGPLWPRTNLTFHDGRLREWDEK